MTNITARVIDSLKATGTTYFVRDSNLPGFAIKVTAKGKVSFVVDGRISGSGTFRIKIGDREYTSLKEAQSKYHDIMATAKKGIDPRLPLQNEAPANRTLAWCLMEHCNLRTIRQSTKDKYRSQIKSGFGSWLNIPIESITPSMIEQRRAELLQSRSINTVNTYLRALKAVLEQGDLDSNPVSRMQKRRRISIQSTATQKDEYLDHDGIRTVLQQYTPEKNYIEVYSKSENEDIYLGPKPVPNIWSAVLFLLLTGGRKQDVYNLTWKLVDTQQKKITLPAFARKENQSHTIPMIGMIEDVIKAQPTHIEHPELVFGMTSEMFRLCYDTEVKPVLNQTSKAMRKTWSEHLFLEGYDPYAIGRGLNHSHTENVTTAHYAKGKLVKLRHLKEMYLKLQVRFAYYALGKHYEIQTKNESLAHSNFLDAYFSLSKFPAFLSSLDIKDEKELLAKFEDPENARFELPFGTPLG
jgi:integrase